MIAINCVISILAGANMGRDVLMRQDDASSSAWNLFFSGRPAYASKSPWGAISASFTALLILAMAPVAAYCAGKTYDWITGLGSAGSFPPGAIDRLLMTHEAVYLFTLHSTFLGFTIFAAGRFNGRAKEVLALASTPKGRRVYINSLLIACLAALVWFAIAMTWVPNLVREDLMPYQLQMARPRSWLIVPIRTLLAPIAEEFLFRGFLFSALSKTELGISGAALVTSLAWTGLHVDRSILAYVQLFGSGLFLC